MKISQHTDHYMAKMLHFNAYEITMCKNIWFFCLFVFWTGSVSWSILWCNKKMRNTVFVKYPWTYIFVFFFIWGILLRVYVFVLISMYRSCSPLFSGGFHGTGVVLWRLLVAFKIASHSGSYSRLSDEPGLSPTSTIFNACEKVTALNFQPEPLIHTNILLPARILDRVDICPGTGI